MSKTRWWRLAGRWGALLVAAIQCTFAHAAEKRDATGARLPTQDPTVGMEGRIVVSLPGTLLQAKPVEPSAVLLVRVADSHPRGALIEYDLRYIGLVPGAYDLSTNLVRVDGSAAPPVPVVMVRVLGLLPPKHSGDLVLPGDGFTKWFGGYRRFIAGLAVLWFLALIAFLWVGRRSRVAVVNPVAVSPPTLAERLRPLVAQAAAGQLPTEGRAQLERMLLNHWRSQLGIEALPMAEAIARVRAHKEAGELWRALETWLHRPPGTAQVNVEQMLAPYSGAAGGSPSERS